MDPTRLFPWAVRAAWAALALAAGPAFAGVLDGRSMAVRTAASVLLWAAWGGGVCASLVSHPIALTALRILSPAAVVTTAWAASNDLGAAGFVALAAAIVAAVLAFLPETGETFVNGPAYPNERRFPLRVPTPLLLGPLVLASVITVGAPVAGILLLAAERWIAGILVLAAGLPAAVVLARALHGLSRRWVVFVPAGLVLHDAMSLADPVLFPKAKITKVELASPTSSALDLTQRAAGLALELVVSEEAPLVLAKVGRGIGVTVDADHILFSPTRPGRVLAELRSRMGVAAPT